MRAATAIDQPACHLDAEEFGVELGRNCGMEMLKRGSSDKDVSPSKHKVCHLVIDPDVYHRTMPRCKIYIAQGGGVPSSGSYRVITTSRFVKYEALYDEFGPMNVLSIMQFIESIEQEFAADSSRDLVYEASKGRKDFTNVAFLIGAYMVLKLDLEPLVVFNCFSGAGESLFEPYRDASPSLPDFKLTLLDCWQGLKRGLNLGWIAVPSNKCPGWSQWGQIYKDEYAHFDNPFNADLHAIVPNKLIAFRAPKDLGGAKFAPRPGARGGGARDFSPEHYAEIFRLLGVTTVIRLEAAPYDAAAFTSRGLAHHDLFYDDAAAPPIAAMGEFFRIVDAAPGLVAVHCADGLGRTGTMAALYAMRCFGLSAREAMAWLRVMRPGSVAGRQQQFLCGIEDASRRLRPPASVARSAAPSAAAAAAASVASAAASLASAGSDDSPAAAAAAAAAAARPKGPPRSCLRRPSVELSSVPVLPEPPISTAPRRAAVGVVQQRMQQRKAARRASIEWAQMPV